MASALDFWTYAAWVPRLNPPSPSSHSPNRVVLTHQKGPFVKMVDLGLLALIGPFIEPIGRGSKGGPTEALYWSNAFKKFMLFSKFICFL